MSAGTSKFSAAEAEAVLLDAARLIFHPEMLPEFLSSRKLPGMNTKAIGEIATPDNWAKGMAKAYDSSAGLSKFLHECIAASAASLSADDCQRALDGFRSRGIPIGPEATEVLAKTQAYLVKNPSDAKWLGLIMFGLSRAISTTARKQFDADEWTDFSLFILEADRSFCEGNGKVFSRCMTTSIKAHPEMNTSFSKMLAANMATALANMVALDPRSALFDGTDPAKYH